MIHIKKQQYIIALFYKLMEGKTIKIPQQAEEFKLSYKTISNYLGEIKLACAEFDFIEYEIDTKKRDGVKFIKKKDRKPVK